MEAATAAAIPEMATAVEVTPARAEALAAAREEILTATRVAVLAIAVPEAEAQAVTLAAEEVLAVLEAEAQAATLTATEVLEAVPREKILAVAQMEAHPAAEKERQPLNLSRKLQNRTKRPVIRSLFCIFTFLLIFATI